MVVFDSSKVLMDESQRDIYNRFGKDSLAFDPRLDELKLLSSIGVVYLYWMVTTYIFTLPIASRACRTWIAILGIALLVLEISLCLTESSLPSWMPPALTEHELIGNVHSVFPAVIVALAAVATSLYVDIDKTSIAVLGELTQHQKVSSFFLTCFFLFVIFIFSTVLFFCLFDSISATVLFD